MKIITYSDLHLEFGSNFKPPKNSDTEELKTKNNGKCLYFDNEVKFEQSASNKGNRKLIKRDIPEINEEPVKKYLMRISEI